MNESLVSLIFAKALMLFLILDPFGNVGILAIYLKDYPLKVQRRILIREVSFSLFILLLFFFGGSYFLDALHISQASVQIVGGLVLFMFALSLLFPDASPIQLGAAKDEPFIVPIAVPFIAGPSSLATTLLFSHSEMSVSVSLTAIFAAWAATAVIIVAAPNMFIWFGKTGIKLCEQLVGLVCTLLSTQMVLSGISIFLSEL